MTNASLAAVDRPKDPAHAVRQLIVSILSEVKRLAKGHSCFQRVGTTLGSADDYLQSNQIDPVTANTQPRVKPYVSCWLDPCHDTSSGACEHCWAPRNSIALFS